MSEQGGGVAVDDLSPQVRRYGVDRPLPERRMLRAGPLSAVLEGPDLRYLAVGGQEVVRRIYVAVRDQNWNTIEPTLSDYTVEEDGLAFVVRFTATHRQGDVDFTWDGRITGTSAGVITCSMDGKVGTTFLRNRIGFCVLHPAALAGTPVEVEQPDSTTISGTFPDRISPHQPFVDIAAIRHGAGIDALIDAEVTIRFSGDVFEMEDQRNWTDASFKTYSTPLSLPIPVEVRAGQHIEQSVTVTVAASAPLPSEMDEEALAEGSLAVIIGTDPIRPLPRIGLGVASHDGSLTQSQIAHLGALRPAHLRVDLDLSRTGWEERLRRGAADGAALGAAIDLEVVVGDDTAGLERLAAILDEGMPVQRLFVFPAAGQVTTEVILARVAAMLGTVGTGPALGGGSRAYFTDLNRATDLPLEGMDVVGYTLNPQVHAFDNASLVETLAGQAATVTSARAIIGDRHLAVGPVTLRPRFNPDAAASEPEPDQTALPPSVDPRQLSLFAAGWTLGSIHRLVEAGADSLTYYETVGWRGVMERDGALTHRELFPSQPEMLFPLYHVLADVAEVAEADLVPAEVEDPLAAAVLALREGDRLRVLVGSFADDQRTVRLMLPPLEDARVSFLDETTYAEATLDGAAFRARPGTPLPLQGGVATLNLRPFAVATIDARLTGG